MLEADNRVLLYRGNLTGTNGASAAPGSAATITLLDTSLMNWEAEGVRYNRIQVNIYSSHDSGASGVVFSSSFDRGANFRTQSSQTYTNAGGPADYDYLMVGGHVKVAYTNSANVLTAWEVEIWGIPARSSGS